MSMLVQVTVVPAFTPNDFRMVLSPPRSRPPPHAARPNASGTRGAVTLR
ncbi:MAG: hypothetical protein ACRDYA_13020 [Egibacteraceae bacterium]